MDSSEEELLSYISVFNTFDEVFFNIILELKLLTRLISLFIATIDVKKDNADLILLTIV